MVVTNPNVYGAPDAAQLQQRPLAGPASPGQPFAVSNVQAASASPDVASFSKPQAIKFGDDKNNNNDGRSTTDKLKDGFTKSWWIIGLAAAAAIASPLTAVAAPFVLAGAAVVGALGLWQFWQGYSNGTDAKADGTSGTTATTNETTGSGLTKGRVPAKITFTDAEKLRDKAAVASLISDIQSSFGTDKEKSLRTVLETIFDKAGIASKDSADPASSDPIYKADKITKDKFVTDAIDWVKSNSGQAKDAKVETILNRVAGASGTNIPSTSLPTISDGDAKLDRNQAAVVAAMLIGLDYLAATVPVRLTVKSDLNVVLEDLKLKAENTATPNLVKIDDVRDALRLEDRSLTNWDNFVKDVKAGKVTGVPDKTEVLGIVEADSPKHVSVENFIKAYLDWVKKI